MGFRSEKDEEGIFVRLALGNFVYALDRGAGHIYYTDSIVLLRNIRKKRIVLKCNSVGTNNEGQIFTFVFVDKPLYVCNIDRANSFFFKS